MREICAQNLSVATMPTSIKAKATPNEIAMECPSTLNDLLGYIESFSNQSSTVSDPQVSDVGLGFTGE